MATYNLKNLLENRYLIDIKYDKSFLDKLIAFKYQWGSKNDTYIEFLGSSLIGVHEIRFSEDDRKFFTRDLLDIDDSELQSDIWHTPGVNKNFKVSSDSLNILFMFLMHKMFTTRDLNPQEKLLSMNILYHLFAYKQIGSLYSHYYKYRVEPDEAQSVFEELGNKFLIKRLGSWEAVFDYQAKLLLPPKGCNASRIVRFTDDDVLKCLNDMQGRIRSLMKNLSKVLYARRENNEFNIKSTTLLTETEDGEGIKDITNGAVNLTDFIKSIIFSPNDFINDDLIYLICSLLPNCRKDKLRETLGRISIEYSRLATSSTGNDIPDWISIIIKQSINYLRTRGIVTDYRKNVAKCLVELKGYFSASKVKIKDIDIMKAYLFKITSEILETKTKWKITPIVIGIILYIFLRSVTSNK